MFGRRRIAAVVAEFLGTAALTLLILSVQRSTIGVPFFVAIAAGLIVALMFFAVGEVSGGYFNPALTIGLWTARRVSTVRAVFYITAQMLGGWGGYWLYRYYINNGLSPVGGHFTGHILVAEAVGTGIFAFGAASVYYKRYTQATAAAFIGISFLLGIVAASPASIGLLNPAVALGIRAWVWGTYVLGPVVGAIIGINLYALLFAEPEELLSGEAATFAVAAVSKTPVTASAKTSVAKKAPAKRAASRRKK